MSQAELDSLNTYFKDNEKKTLTISDVPENKYLCIRIDGFKATKKYLKDILINDDFNNKLAISYENLFFSFRKYFTNIYSSSIICAFIVNDELSIILNKDNANDGKRIMKVTTLFSSSISSSMTRQYEEDRLIFDARPLILDKNDISKYIRYRYLISLRYSYWKVLRLNNYKDVYEDRIKQNLENCIIAVEKINKKDDAIKLINTINFFITEKKKNPSFTSMKISKKYMQLAYLNNIICEYLNFLHKNKLIKS
ncbi:tRNA(His) guanylyltransferase Thg1 family protein [Poseidonibacter lekithochrous]|uniref:tRNA(His) guanylyltransferase Thg1 family protein n=1 Tax=Poseidonibacter lekithochrous TaxID=1904463 RepID=UPI000D359111|nr:tRNA(His) guanylyltransferase Thg1 family protein [Poseidonibacter lekithochrous]